jgi:hypothetical protein
LDWATRLGQQSLPEEAVTSFLRRIKEDNGSKNYGLTSALNLILKCVNIFFSRWIKFRHFFQLVFGHETRKYDHQISAATVEFNGIHQA